jgi:hypothetical protein
LTRDTNIGALQGSAAFVLAAATTGADTSSRGSDARAAQASTPFPDAHDRPPTGWTGPVFHLSQNYPTSLPALGTAPWRQIDFRTQSVAYLKAVLAYALAGNTPVDFRGQDNGVRKWYHAPWMHAGAAGREFIHGLTHERTSQPKELAPTQTSSAQNWAVSMYNPRGGYIVGRVWKNHVAPDPTKANFPEGTVAFKLLFTGAPVSQVPYLAGSLEWQADINRATGTGARPTLRLLQVDVAIRDARANSTTGWVFGTFVYNGQAAGATIWDHLIPVGAMWGNDPDRLADNGPLEETAINPAALSIMQHLGYKGRLNGPVDNPRSSCLSCHSTAQIPSDLSQPTVSGIVPANASAATLRRYFRNITSGTAFTPGQISLGYSLQLQNGIANIAQSGTLQPAAHPTPDANNRKRRLHRAHGIKVTRIKR